MTDGPAKELLGRHLAQLEAMAAEVRGLLGGGPAGLAGLDLAGWPPAVPPGLLVRGEADRQLRAQQILEWATPSPGSTFLDCGCGDGRVAALAAEHCRIAVGYDPAPHPHWQSCAADNLFLVQEWDRATVHAPYDLIVAFDALDHLAGRSPVQLLRELTALLAPGGLLKLRCHPWTARHGGHLYEEPGEIKNFAYLHLLLDPADWEQLGRSRPEWRVNRPWATYDGLVKATGLEVITRRAQLQDPEEFFSGDLLRRLTRAAWEDQVDAATARKILAHQFIDYTLRKPA